MTYRISRRGWLPDPLDPRDLTIRDLHVQAALDDVLPRVAPARSPQQGSRVGELRVDLRPWCSAVEDQGDVGSCTAHAVVGAFEYFQRRTSGDHVDASRRFLYRVTRRHLGWEGQGDTGAFIRSAIKSLRVFGAPPERYWPYEAAEYDREPEAFHYAFAQTFRAIEYFRLEQSVPQLKSALDSGLPFAFGFTCFTSLDSPEVAQTGVIPYPGRHEHMTGGHAVLAVGYTDSHVLVRNSWGTSWGERGYGYLPWEYFDDRRPLADDCWVLVNASFVLDDARARASAPHAWPRVESAATRMFSTPREPHLHTSRRGAYVEIARGRDPLAAMPLLLTKSGVRPADQTVKGLTRTNRPVSLHLTSLTLNESFEWDLFKPAVHEIYAVALAWDLSGAPPRVWPSRGIFQTESAASTTEALTYALRKGETIRFVGDGVQLWPASEIVGGLYVRLFIVESDGNTRAIGRRMALVNESVERSPLTTSLAALAGSAGPTGAALAAVAAAAHAVAAAVAAALSDDADDAVALFDGTYAPEHATGTERYEQRGATVELAFRTPA